MKRTLWSIVSCLTVWVVLATNAATVFAQSPAFPNVQPVSPSPFRDFPYHKYRVDERWGPVFPPDVIIMRTAPPRPNDYPYSLGYGSSPYFRVYGGAGSFSQTPRP